MKDKLILKNGIEIEIESASSLSDIKVLSETKYNMVSAWDMLTEENLKSVQIQNADGLTIGKYEDLALDNETSIMQKNGAILTSFHLREKTDVEKDIDNLKTGQEMLTGAIDDLGAVTSALAEAQEGGLS